MAIMADIIFRSYMMSFLRIFFKANNCLIIVIMLQKFNNFTGLVLLRLVVSFSWVSMVPSKILVMLLDSDPDNGF